MTQQNQDIHWRLPVGLKVECGANYKDAAYARNELEKVTCAECLETNINRLRQTVSDFPQHGSDKTNAQIAKIQRRIAKVS